MKKWLIITNVWGKKLNKFGNLIDTFKEEREYFDTLEDLKAYIKLFEDICNTYEIPEKRKLDSWDKRYYGDKPQYEFKNTNQRLWGYVVGNTETQTIEKWGGISLLNLSKRDSMLRQKDYLFRGSDEIPKNYKWDVGEYDGWLQYRWGNGKNAVGYVEPEKPKKNDEIIEEEEVEETSYYDDSFDNSFAEEIENAYAKLEDKELIKKLEDRW